MSQRYTVFQRALADSVLEGFSHIPDEKTDESWFSPVFRVWISKTIRKTQRRSWYYVNTTLKKVVLVAIIISLLAVTAVAAIPAIRRAVDSKKPKVVIVNEYEDHYGVAFDPEDVADAPDQIEIHYAPSYIPEGYWKSGQIIDSNTTYLRWENAEGRHIIYSQDTIPDDYEGQYIDSEGVEKTVTSLGGQTVTLFTDVEFHEAVWTDGYYSYYLLASPAISLDTMGQMIQSIEPQYGQNGR